MAAAGTWHECTDPNEGAAYWYNDATDECLWEKPAAADAAFAASDSATAELQARAEAAFMKRVMMVATMDKRDVKLVKRHTEDQRRNAAASPWVACYDPSSAAYYYVHKETGESQWDKPDTFVAAADDTEMAAVVKLQCMYRRRMARVAASRAKIHGVATAAAYGDSEVEESKGYATATVDAGEEVGDDGYTAAERALFAAVGEDAPPPARVRLAPLRTGVSAESPTGLRSPGTATSEEKARSPLRVMLSRTSSKHGDGDDKAAAKLKTEQPEEWSAKKWSRYFNQQLEHHDDWETLQWLKPSMEIAWDHRRKVVYQGGEAPVYSTSLDKMSGHMGVGIGLWFRMLKYLTMIFLVMAFLALPTFYINRAGSRIPSEERDILGMAELSIGNQGLDEKTLIAEGRLPNQTYVVLVGQEVPQATASLIVAISDMAQTVIFCMFFLWFQRKVIELKDEASEGTVTAADYAVFVRGLPADATVEEVRDHFSKLYDLTSWDWSYRGWWFTGLWRKESRAPLMSSRTKAAQHDVEAAKKLQEELSASHRMTRAEAARQAHKATVGAAADDDHIGARYLLPEKKATPKSGQNRFTTRQPTDVAAPVFHRAEDEHNRERDEDPEPVADTSNTGDASYVGSWVAEVHLIHPNGTAIMRYLKLRKLQHALVHRRAMVLMHQFHIKQAEAGEKPTGALLAAVKQAQKNLHKLDKQLAASRGSKRTASADVVGAFVVFNEQDSRMRCIKDYYPDWWFRRLHQPPPIRFRGTHVLKVRAAPEPEDIHWENLDFSSRLKFFRRSVAVLLMVGLLTVSLSVILAASIARAEASASIPDDTFCSGTLPSLILRQADPDTELKLERDIEKERDCPAGAHYLSFPMTAEEDTILYNASRADTHCAIHCIPEVSDVTCQGPTSGLYAKEPDFKLTAVLGCYCIGVMRDALSDQGAFAAMNEILSGSDREACFEFASQWVSVQGLVFVAAGVAAVVNAILKFCLSALSKWERHDTTSETATAVALRIFIAQYLNTAVVLMIVNAQLPNVVPIKGLGLFEGSFPDFVSGWYSAVGAQIALTLLLSAGVPLAVPLLQLMILLPLQRWFGTRSGSSELPSQEDLNKLYEGPTYNISTRLPVALNFLFVTLTFSAGLPAMLLLGAGFFATTFWVDKIVLLKLYNRPTRMDHRLADISAKLMPYAVMIHCAMAVYMYGETDTIQSDPINSGTLTSSTSTFSQYDIIGIMSRISRANTLPAFIMLGILVLWYFFERLTALILKLVLFILSCGLLGRKKSVANEDERGIAPPYTGEYIEVVTKAEATAIASRSEVRNYKDEEHLSAADKSSLAVHGKWRIVNDEGRMYRTREWARDVDMDGVHHKKGDRMRTWEVIRETTLHTYDIFANVHYKRAMTAIWKDTRERLRNDEAFRAEMVASAGADVVNQGLRSLRNFSSSAGSDSPTSVSKTPSRFGKFGSRKVAPSPQHATGTPITNPTPENAPLEQSPV